MLVLHVGVYSKTNLNYEGFIILKQGNGPKQCMYFCKSGFTRYHTAAINCACT